jgi:hypothetical protein
MHPEKLPNRGRSPDSLEARLRALPLPAVPADLEARLLATVPAELPITHRRWAVWVGLGSALVAACLLAVLAWPKGDGKAPVLPPEKRELTHQVPPAPPDDSDRLSAWRLTRRILDGAEPPPFTWPLQETTPPTIGTSIPSDLLD